MSLAVSERIAQTIERRLDAVRGLRVYRPEQHDEQTPVDRQVVLVEGDTVRNNEYSLPGNPPRTAWDTTWEIRCQLSNESSDDAVDTRKSAIRAEVHAAVCDATNWHTFGGLAQDADLGDVEAPVISDGVFTYKVPLTVTYRTSEYDLTVLG